MAQQDMPARRADAAGGQDDIDRGLAHVSILVIDDEPGIRNFLQRTLEPVCKRVVLAENALEATRILDAHHFDLVLFDNVMPQLSGLDWLAAQRKVGFFSEAILMTAYADLDTAIQALRVGATDLLVKPFRSNQVLNALRRAMDQRLLRQENSLLKYELKVGISRARGRFLGASPRIQAVRETLQRLAAIPSPVLLTGESGTGKEIAARTLHSISDRAEKPFVPVNCAGLTSDLAMVELFGTIGAERKDGLLMLANGGTLFLDEISETPLPVQAMLLRVLEDKRMRPIGSDREMPLNLRIICATNADLPRAVEEGRFREDLYHRINVVPVDIPPLRDRVGDLPELAALFMEQLSRDLGVSPLPLSADVIGKLAAYHWPGNVRELRNLIERSLIHGAFPAEFAAPTGSESPRHEPVESLAAVERLHIQTVLQACGGNRAEAARRLGVSRKTIDRKCAAWDD